MTNSNVIKPEYRVLSEDGRELYFGRDIRIANDWAGIALTNVFYERLDPSHPAEPWVKRGIL